MTSPEGSPRPLDRYRREFRHHHDFDDEGHHFDERYVVEEGREDGEGYVMHVERHHRQERRVDHRSDRSTHSGREEVFSQAETEVSGWARKH